jgi:predicted nucleotidyltransferase component of viral defense system
VLANVDVRRVLDARARGGDDRNTVEKDYALSYLLAGIAAVPDLYSIALFKGGTCLRKAYFEDHRFSVDLDYTLTRRLPCDDLQRLIQAAADQATGLLQEHGDFRVDVRVPSHRADHEKRSV